MAGVGKPPTDPSKRRRRNKETRHEVADDGKVRGPELPATYRVTLIDDEGQARVRHVRFLEVTRGWYEAWRRAPQAQQFVATDWNRLLLVIAPMMDGYIRSPKTSLATEIRLQETLLGGTIVDRQRLRIDVKAPPPPPPASQTPSRPARDDLAARRARVTKKAVGE
jgi:hypothetical protein